MSKQSVGSRDVKLSTRIKGQDVSLFLITDDDIIMSTSYEGAKAYYVTRNKNAQLDNIWSKEDCVIVDLNEQRFEDDMIKFYPGRTSVLYTYCFDDYDDPTLESLDLDLDLDFGEPIGELLETDEQKRSNIDYLASVLTDIRDIVLEDCHKKDVDIFDMWLLEVTVEPEAVSELVREYIRTVVNGEDE